MLHGCTCSNVPQRVGCTELPALCPHAGTLCSHHWHARQQPALCTGHRLPCALLAGSFCWWRLAGPSPAQRVPLMLQGGLPGPQASGLKAGRLAGGFSVHKLGFTPGGSALLTSLWVAIYTCSHGKYYREHSKTVPITLCSKLMRWECACAGSAAAMRLSCMGYCHTYLPCAEL